jgi:hypothetical protein
VEAVKFYNYVPTAEEMARLDEFMQERTRRLGAEGTTGVNARTKELIKAFPHMSCRKLGAFLAYYFDHRPGIWNIEVTITRSKNYLVSIRGETTG